MPSNTLHHVKNLFLIILGALIFSIGVNYFAIPNNLAEGGVTGISIILHYQFGWNTGTVIFLLNIPLIFIGYKVFGKKTLIYTFIATIAATVCLHLTDGIGEKMDDLLLASLFFGVLVGAGLGLIIRVGGTMGGADVIARVLNRTLGWSIGHMLLFLDFAVIVSSIFVIGLDMAMYTLVAVFVSSQVLNFVVEGLNVSRAVTIISNQPEELAKEITEKMNRGVTVLQGHGAYTKKNREVLYVVVLPSELPKLKELVHNFDSDAFVVVHDAREVLGGGFTYKGN
jgi:uncharacterized membrane-anchored protein YitT (DUF2179 family)